MAPKNLIQVLKENLEREAEFEGRPLNVWVKCCDKMAKAKIAVFVEGKWQMFDVLATPAGESEALTI
jgi:hypothetical protein